MRALACLFVLVWPPSIAATQSLTITPVGGVHVPLKRIADALPTDICDHDPCGFPHQQRRVQAAPAVGLTLALQSAGRSSLAISVMRAASEVAAPAPNDEGSVARNTFVALRYVFSQPLNATTNVSVGVGPSFNSLRGAAYEGWSRNALGASFSTSLQTRTSPGMGFEVGMTYTLYSIKSEPGTDPTRIALRQQDLVLFAGLALRLPL